MRSILILGLIILTSCAKHSVTIGEFTVYGSNEQEIPAPTRSNN